INPEGAQKHNSASSGNNQFQIIILFIPQSNPVSFSFYCILFPIRSGTHHHLFPLGYRAAQRFHPCINDYPQSSVKPRPCKCEHASADQLPNRSIVCFFIYIVIPDHNKLTDKVAKCALLSPWHGLPVIFFQNSFHTTLIPVK